MRSTMHRTTTLALTGTALAALAVGASAAGASAQSTDQEALVSAAVTSSPATAGVPTGDYTVTDVQVVDDAWASAHLEPAVGADLDPATAVLQFTDGTWQVVDLGTAQVGCGIVPAGVEAELALTC